MKFKLVVTYSDEKIDVFKRLLNSLKNQKEQFLIVCVYQGQQSIDEHYSMIKEYVEDKFVLLQSERCSLSKARNKALEYIYENYHIHEDDLILFPDDDCWYENDFFEKVSNLDWKANEFYSFRVFDPYEKKEFGKRKKDISVNLNYLNSFRLPISVGLVIKLNVFRENVNHFNELLGVGAPVGSGEETEVVLTLLHKKCKGNYYGFIDVYHEVYKVDEVFILKYAKYAIGQGYCLKIFARRFSPVIWLVFIELLIRSFVGYLVSSKNLSVMYKIRFISLVKGIFHNYDK